MRGKIMARLLLCGVLACLLLSSAAQGRADEAEGRAIAFVTNLGGMVFRDENQLGKPVVRVTLRLRPLTRASVRELAVFRNLTHLNLGFTNLTDAGVKELTVLKNLTELSLQGSMVTEAGLKELVAL